MSYEIDPVEFGKLISSVESLTTAVTMLTSEVDVLKSQLTGGKGVIAGLLLAAGGLGAAGSRILEHAFIKLT